MKLKYVLYVTVFFYCFNLNALTLDRVILSTDDNSLYIDFWPIVAKAWTKLVGVKPTLALIGDKNVTVDERLGDVIRFDPIEGIPDGFYAQVVRLLLPAYFPNDVCITSDIDMMPLSGNYFISNVRGISEDKFVVYRDKAGFRGRYPMCYVAAKGCIFQDIFKLKNVLDIPKIVKDWYSRKLGWGTDEKLLLKYVTEWNIKSKCCIKLGHDTERRICRSAWKYDPKLLKDGYYIESHMLRPYKDYADEINKLAKMVGVF